VLQNAKGILLIIRKRAALRLAGAGGVLAAVLVGGALVGVPAQASVVVSSDTAVVNGAGAGCPAGTSTVVPDQATVRQFGARALVPADVQQADPTAVQSPVLQKIAALNPTWVTKVDCTITNRSHGPSGLGKLPVPDRTNNNSATTTSHNWSGYVSPLPMQGNYTANVGMEWNVGPSGGPTDADISESDWPGMGSGSSSSDMLIQAGSDIERGKVADGIVPWYELYPQENEVVINSLPTTQQVVTHYLVNVEYDKPKNTANFVVCVDSKCANINQKLAGKSTAQQAEWIRERPTSAGYFHPLAATRNETFTNAGGSWSDGKLSYGFVPGASTLPDWALDKITMVGCNNKTTLVVPNDISSSGSFTTTVKDEGLKEHC
jgi:hypothetical protein